MTIVDDAMGEVLTQYRESPKLLALIRHDLDAMYDVFQRAQALPRKFDILDAEGEQLTLIGKRVGFPREHCICVPVPVLGFDCAPGSQNVNIVGFCAGGSWYACNDAGEGTISIEDDDLYRRHIIARLYQMRQLWGIDSLSAAVKAIWGETATVTNMGGARVCVSPGRLLTEMEGLLIQVSFRALPIPPGIKTYISQATGQVIGFGGGWGGLCDGAEWLCPIEFDPFGCDFTWQNPETTLPELFITSDGLIFNAADGPFYLDS
ncbi:DUF2612 domain-containing protein [Martelella lutilitoris]|uniref:DUF2612 domain-containing protein n=1 Tax=Martelella lutilitoris TaxID=2583532 RepID=A0A7T7KKW0_9HYPH|nr:DUF2612 domain-containing protein [Martelella lutilitoris]QQM29284.1 DUF2612 domain-containing protein [Martelella lutilitoris]